MKLTYACLLTIIWYSFVRQITYCTYENVCLILRITMSLGNYDASVMGAWHCFTMQGDILSFWIFFYIARACLRQEWHLVSCYCRLS